MDYGDYTSSGDYLRASTLNTIVIVAKDIRRFHGPYNIDLTRSSVVSDHATIYLSEDISYIGGCDNIDDSYRTFDILYKDTSVSGCYNWKDVRLSCEDLSNIHVIVSGIGASPEVISDMSAFTIANFECVGGHDHNA